MHGRQAFPVKNSEFPWHSFNSFNYFKESNLLILELYIKNRVNRSTFSPLNFSNISLSAIYDSFYGIK